MRVSSQPAAALLLAMLLAQPPAQISAAEPVALVVDAARPGAVIPALHGVNNGPMDVGGTVDLSGFHRALKVPSVRLHDVHWPNSDVVDVHAVFPVPEADPGRPVNYDFARTDDYLKAIEATGARIVYRLGESIEHAPRKIHVHPPSRPEAWASACLGIIRHFNEGWAGGMRLGIHDWEIWNEPDNRPNQWTGGDDEYFRLYATTARAIKREFPSLRVGGPAVGNVGSLVNGRLQTSPFVRDFLAFCRREAVPLDFFSWHLYAPEPSSFGAMARHVRRLLDREGFDRTASYLTEWNELPDGDWSPVLPGGQGLKRERFYDRIGGAEGAAFLACALMSLQENPVNLAHYYAGDTSPFGLFTRHGVPRKNYHAMRACAELGGLTRLSTSGGNPAHLEISAGMRPSGDAAIVLVANFDDPREDLHLEIGNLGWASHAKAEVKILDATRELEPIQLDGQRVQTEMHFRLKAPAIALVELRRKQGGLQMP